jgi:hypothetical protein
MDKLVKEGVLSKTGRDRYIINKQKVVFITFPPFIILKAVSVSAGQLTLHFILTN